jgi:hypothetical protein
LVDLYFVGFHSCASRYALGHSCAVVRPIDDARRELAALGIETREALESGPLPAAALHELPTAKTSQ